MKKKSQKRLMAAVCALVAFVVWTVLVRFVDVRAIGPGGSSVGLATLNRFVHDRIGVHMPLYTITDWLGLVPIATAVGFAVLGLVQWSRRRRFGEVDRSILALGVLYMALGAVYVFFETVVVNKRPVLLDGYLEASYPSSTTMLVLCVMTTAAGQARARIQSGVLRRCMIVAILAFTAFMVAGRILAGVHWITDIIGGALLSTGLVEAYHAICGSEKP